MKARLSNYRVDKISLDDYNYIKHNIDLYEMYMEYINECNKIRVKNKKISEKLDKYEHEVMDYSDQKNRIVTENDFNKLYDSLKKSLEEGYDNKEEFTNLINKFNEIDSIKDSKVKQKRIKELDINVGYRKYKNDILKANDLNDSLIDNLNKRINEIEEMYIIGDESERKVNTEVINEFNKKISAINIKIKRNKESIKKNTDEINGLINELNKFLQLNNYEDLHVYRNYLQKINFIVKKY